MYGFLDHFTSPHLLCYCIMFVRLAAAGASSSEDISNRVLVPYERLFKSPDVDIVVKATVTAIKPNSIVLLESHKLCGPEIDYLVSLFRDILLIIGHRKEVPDMVQLNCTPIQQGRYAHS